MQVKATTSVKPKNDQRDKEALLANNEVARLQTLLLLEAEMRAQRDVDALSIWTVNELRAILDYSQCIFLRLDKGRRARVAAVSSLAEVDRHAPFIRWIESRVDALLMTIKNDRTTGAAVLPLSTSSSEKKSELNSGFDAQAVYPFSHVTCLPLRDFDGQVFGVLLFARRKNWAKNDEIIMERLGNSFEHAIQTLVPRRKLKTWHFSRWLGFSVGALCCLAMFIRVPMTALAPGEIVADQPRIIAAPIEGVIKKIHLDANVVVKRGDVLFTLEDTALKANAEVAQRKELVAQARYLTAKQAAFSDPKSSKQLAVAKAEVELARVERLFAQKQLARSVVKADQSGLLIYSDKKEWIGKPVRIGERIMEIADPQKVQVKIDLPVGDAISFQSNAEVKFYLDARPLSPIKAHVFRASYRAKDVAGVGLVYQVVAELKSKELRVPRIGLRGTAKVFGEEVFLGFYLFRKPISAVRQYFGL